MLLHGTGKCATLSMLGGRGRVGGDAVMINEIFLSRQHKKLR